MKNANRMMSAANPAADGIELSFADGATGIIPYASLLDGKDPGLVSSLELPNPYEMLLHTEDGERIEVPWDFARHYCGPYYQPSVELMAALGRQAIGLRIRRLRESAGLTQTDLAASAGLARITLLRLEKGEHSPRFSTLQSIAEALSITVSDLMTGPDKPL